MFSALKQKLTCRNEGHGDYTCQERKGAGPPEIQNVLGEALINYSGTTCFSSIKSACRHLGYAALLRFSFWCQTKFMNH